MADIVTLQDNEGKDLYPNTKTEAVIDSNGNRLDRVLKGALYTGATPTGEVKAVPIDAGTLNGHSDSYFATKKSVDDLNASLNSDDITLMDGVYLHRQGNSVKISIALNASVSNTTPSISAIVIPKEYRPKHRAYVQGCVLVNSVIANICWAMNTDGSVQIYTDRQFINGYSVGNGEWYIGD